MKRVFVFAIITCFFLANINSQSIKREFRAVWVATVANIDWPSKPGLSVSELKAEVIQTLEHHKKNNVNAIILQVRPAADAFYLSELEPWSKYLSGVQGMAPESTFDPLEFWIEESHKCGMELHAWFNPYRIKVSENDSLSVNHIIKKHPEWSWQYGNKLFFEPGNPDVWSYLVKVVADVVERYDIDAVHFDDYFYPYKISGQEIPDSAAFEKFGSIYYPDRIEDWRRSNVDTIIQLLDSSIKSIKPWVQFGISPFGVWRNSKDDVLGSESNAGTTNYDGLYADVIKWQRKGWIDYLMPQLYWRDDHPAVDFSTLAYWWSDYNYGRNVYVGLAPYKIDKKSQHKLWRKDKYLLQQIEILRSINGISGFGFFSSKHFLRNDLKRFDLKFAKKYCPYPVLLPEMPWLDNIPPAAPQNLMVESGVLKWNDNLGNDSELNKAKFFVIYKYDVDEKRQLKQPEKIVEITSANEYVIQKKHKQGIYRISAVDRANNESLLSKPLKIE